MAHVIFHDGQKTNLSADKAQTVWQVLTGQIEGTDKQQQFVASIKKIYLNWRNAPDDYLLQNAEILRELVILSWMANPKDGSYTMPEYSDTVNWRVSHTIGLLQDGKPTAWVGKINKENT